MSASGRARVIQPRHDDRRASYLSALIESTTSLIWVVDLDFRLKIFNHAFADAVLDHCHVKAAEGMSPQELCPAAHPEQWLSMYERALSEGAFRSDMEVAGGRWLEFALNPVVEDGEPIGVSVLGHDVTGRRLTEELRKASETRFRTVIDKAPIGIVIHRDRVNLYANQKWLEIHGLQDDSKVAGHPVEKWLAPDGRRLAQERSRLRRKGIQVPEEYENTALRADGREIPVQVASTEVNLTDGPAKLVFITDISQRNATEKALKESEARLRSYFELPLVGIAVSSPDKGFLAANDRICEMLGYEREELMRTTWPEITHPEDLACDLEQYALMMSGERETHTTDKRFVRKDGQVIWASMSVGCTRKPDGSVDTFCAMLQDITARKKAEAGLKEHLRDLKLLSEMNVSLLKAGSEPELLEDYCRIIVESGGYKMAWVGFPGDGDEKPVKPAACFGDETKYLERVRVSWAQVERGMGPVGRAIRTGQVQYSDDLATDPTMAFSRDNALRSGYRSIIAVPFRQSETEWACLTAYGDRPMHWTDSERELMEQVASALGFGIKSLRTVLARDRYQQDLFKSLEQTIQVIADTVDQRDPYTAGHQRRVADLCSHIARKLGLNEERMRGLRLAASIHDLGKIAIPAEILAKPGKLSPIQYSLVKEHVQLGFEIVKGVHFPWPISEMIHQHHERLDGSGYPQGLKGDAILLESRILMVADVLEAMATHRPYRVARGIDAALQEIEDGRGSKYDSTVADACLELFRKNGYQLPD